MGKRTWQEKEASKKRINNFKGYAGLFAFINFGIFWYLVGYMPYYTYEDCETGQKEISHIIMTLYLLLLAGLDCVFFVLRPQIIRERYIAGRPASQLITFAFNEVLTVLANLDSYTDVCFLIIVSDSGNNTLFRASLYIFLIAYIPKFLVLFLQWGKDMRASIITMMELKGLYYLYENTMPINIAANSRKTIKYYTLYKGVIEDLGQTILHIYYINNVDELCPGKDAANFIVYISLLLSIIFTFISISMAFKKAKVEQIITERLNQEKCILGSPSRSDSYTQDIILYIAKAIEKNPRTKYLHLKKVAFGDNFSEVAKAIAKNDKIETLLLNKSDIKGLQVKELVEAIEERGFMKCLNLNNTEIGVDGGASIVQLLSSNIRMEELRMYSCEMKQSTIKEIISILPNNQNLQILDISCNELLNVEAYTLGEILPQITILRELCLGGNYFEKDGLVALAEGIKANISLSFLQLGNLYINLVYWEYMGCRRRL